MNSHDVAAENTNGGSVKAVESSGCNEVESIMVVFVGIGNTSEEYEVPDTNDPSQHNNAQ